MKHHVTNYSWMALRTVALPIAAFAALSCASYSDTASGVAEVTGVASEAVEAADADAPAFPEQAVVGIMRKVANGKVAWSRALDAKSTLPANVGELLQSGKPDKDGYVYRDVAGAYSNDGTTVYHLQYIARRPRTFADPADMDSKPAGPPAPPRPLKPKMNRELASALVSEPADTVVEVYVNLAHSFTTSLRATRQFGAASLASVEEEAADRSARIVTRKKEATARQAAVADHLQNLGATDIHGFWTSNAVSAKLPLARIEALVRHSDVASVSMPGAVKDAEWTGADMKSSAGLNGGIYHDNGFHGQAYANNTGGRNMRLGVIGQGFQINHPGFLDGPNSPTRAVEFNCNSSCEIDSSGIAGAHAQKVAGLAGGSIRQHQIAGLTAAQELERSGMAEEPDLYLFAINNLTAAKRAIEAAMDMGVDVLVSSTIFDSDTCDGEVGMGVEATIYDAQLLGMIVVNAVGNSYDGSGSCTVTGLSEAPSTFSVGALGGSVSECSASNYGSCNIGSYSDRGGMNTETNGTTRPGALSLVAALAPGCPKYYFNTTGGISTSSACGTSYAAPQVGGAGIMIKDWFLDQGYTAINIEGRLFAVLQAMTDRADSASGYRTTGFDPRWGGGRFQARFFDGSDMGYPWGWETYSAVLEEGEVDLHPFNGSAAEPAGLQQFKSHMIFFEQSAADGIADIDLSVANNNCSTGYTTYGSDVSYDVKSTVRVGTAAAGNAICTRLHAYSVPGLGLWGESRRAHVFNYYSGNTNMR